MILNAAKEHSIGEAFLAVRKVASAAAPESDVGLALRPLETKLAEALGQRGHKQAREQSWLSESGSMRCEFVRYCEGECNQKLTPRVRSRLFNTYHKLYGSAQQTGEALFNSESYMHYLRKGYKRPGKKMKQVFKLKIEIDSIEQENETETTPTGPPQEVVCPMGSKRCRKRCKKHQVIQLSLPQVLVPHALQQPVDPVESHQFEQHTVDHMVQTPWMWTSPHWCTNAQYTGHYCRRSSSLCKTSRNTIC